MRTVKKFPIPTPVDFKNKLLHWSRQFEEISWLDSNDYSQEHSKFDAILAVQAFTALKTDYSGAFDQLQEYQSTTRDWIFGYLSYDLKNDVEDISSNNFDGLDFPDLYFFQPQKLFILKGETIEFHYLNMVEDEMDFDFQEIMDWEAEEIYLPIIPDLKQGLKYKQKASFVPEAPLYPSLNNDSIPAIAAIPSKTTVQNLSIKARIPKQQYLEKVNEMLRHIHRGDIYEANFCQEFYAENVEIEPLTVFKDLNAISGTPFAVFLKLEENYLMSASPERYLQKDGKILTSQPIKGTARRSKDKVLDEKIALELEKDPKERSENVMIVDLVRNDLSRVAQRGSVIVEELCKVYSFKQVHQMISTVSAVLDNAIPPVEVLRSTFPMGSMTGAPKISAMKIIEMLEETRRGLYSGAVGYFTPQGDFDFNVVIRSILYNSSKKYVSFSVGGAITAQSIPEQEYEECLLKSEAMRRVLQN